MGTSGFVGFVVDGQEKIAYNHFDSYPSATGQTVLAWLRAITEDVFLIEGARAAAAEARLVTDADKPTIDDVQRLVELGFAQMDVSSGRIDDWYVLLRDTQGDPGRMLEAGIIENAGRNWPADSLMCEWGYVIDFDGDRFEVYKGFQHGPHEEGRFADRSAPEQNSGYYAVKLVASWSLAELPDPIVLDELEAKLDAEHGDF